MKSIELTQSQLTAKQNGATMFLFPIKDIHNDYEFQGYSSGEDGIWNVTFWNEKTENLIIKTLPIQIGDKDIFIKESFHCDKNGIVYYKDDFEFNQYLTNDPSRMTREQSRYSFDECVNVRVLRVQEIFGNDKANIIGKTEKLGYILDDFSEWYYNYMKELKIKRTYNHNDYVFLVEFKVNK